MPNPQGVFVVTGFRIYTSNQFITNTNLSVSQRLQRKHWMMTFPQCHTEKAVVESNLPLLETKIPLTGYIIAKEKHADGEPHLHVLLSFSKPINLKNMRFFDVLAGKHANIVGIQNLVATVKYVMKEDPTPLLGGTFSHSLPYDSAMRKAQNRAGSKTSDEVAKKVQDGSSFQSVLEEYPGLSLSGDHLYMTELMKSLASAYHGPILRYTFKDLSSPSSYLFAGTQICARPLSFAFSPHVSASIGPPTRITSTDIQMTRLTSYVSTNSAPKTALSLC